MFPDIGKSLKPKVESRLPAIRITDLLLEVDARAGFSNAFTHLRSGRTADSKLALLTAILADGINLGLTRMADVSPGITMRQLAWAHDWHIREEGYAAAHAILVNAQRQLPLASLRAMELRRLQTASIFRQAATPRRSATSTAGMVPIPARSSIASLRPVRRFPYHRHECQCERGHLCPRRPALPWQRPRHRNALCRYRRVSDMSFALCHLVGFQLVPRLRGLKDRRLYLFPGDTPPENLASLVGEPINVERIKANWNDILRLVTTIRSGQVRPSTLLAKLSAFPRQNGLALALRDLGRINRSIFLPQWWQNPEMRWNATAGLNKSESQNTLARALFFNRLGELRDRTFESQFYRASGLNLLINAIVYWNTLYLEPAFGELNREGIATTPDVIKHITPLGWQHISLTGDYIWTPTDSADLRPLRRETSILAA